ncbi:hypothetical protein T492DRAFT_836651 [Pavlovales sp. CCMP2436]|nr:hypothetical protein T492DRAFT_836651 [Pavlovales sp. CCMP2436]
MFRNPPGGWPRVLASQILAWILVWAAGLGLVSGNVWLLWLSLGLASGSPMFRLAWAATGLGFLLRRPPRRSEARVTSAAPPAEPLLPIQNPPATSCKCCRITTRVSVDDDSQRAHVAVRADAGSGTTADLDGLTSLPAKGRTDGRARTARSSARICRNDLDSNDHAAQGRSLPLNYLSAHPPTEAQRAALEPSAAALDNLGR